MKDSENIQETVSFATETWLDFISRIVEASAWPIAVFAVAFLFRRELRNVAGKLKRLKWGDAEAVFDAGVAEAKEVAKTLDPVSDDAASVNDEQTYTLLQQANYSPTGAVIEAYKQVEERLAQVINLAQEDLEQHLRGSSRKMTDPKHMPPYLLHRALHKSGWLSDAEMRMLQSLREIRNVAAHSTELGISSNSAKEFVKLASSLEDALQSKIRIQQVDD